MNAVNTFKELLSMNVVPIVNENDTVSVTVSLTIYIIQKAMNENIRRTGNPIR
jgi:hypothetical protein